MLGKDTSMEKLVSMPSRRASTVQQQDAVAREESGELLFVSMPSHRASIVQQRSCNPQQWAGYRFQCPLIGQA